MASILNWNEDESVSYADHTDDVKVICRDCRSAEEWQSHLLRSLQASGWTLGMLLYLPAPLPFHWFMLLRHECSFRLLDEITHRSSKAYQTCGDDRRLWMSLACKSLTLRGWTPTMLAKAWRVPKTNIYRFLEIDLGCTQNSA